MTGRDRLLTLLVAVMWGTNFVSIHVGLQHFPPLFFAALRYAVIAVPTIMLVPRPTGQIGWLIGYGLTFGALQFGLLFVAITVGMPAGLSSLVLQAAVPLTVVLGVLLLGERLTTRRIAGVLAALAGLAAIGWERAEAAAIVPMLLTLAAAAAMAASNLCGRAARPADPLRFILWSSVVPPLPLLGVSWWLEGPAAGWAALLRAPTAQGWPGLAALGFVVVFGTVVGTAIWTGLLARNPAHLVAPYSLLVPVVGMVATAALIGERPGPVAVLAGLVIIAGVLVGTAPPRTGSTDPERRRGRLRRIGQLARPSYHAWQTARPWIVR